MRLISAICFVLVLFSCKKDEVMPCEDTSALSNGMVVLCEGLFQQNNSSISFIDFNNGAVDNSFFANRVGRQLGDTGNDMQKYGGKIYVVVNISSTIEVLDASTFTSIEQISMINGGTSKQPRSLYFHNGNVYVTCYDGFVDVIDTTSLNVIQRIAVGTNPEGLTVSGNKLYVSNSGGLNAPVMDSTVSVIDLTTHQEIQKITVGLNPGPMITDQAGDVYVIARGNYSSIPSRMVRIDATTDQVAEQFSFDASGVTHFNNKFLVSYYDYSTSQNTVGLFDPANEVMENPSFMGLADVTTLYNVQYNVGRDQIFVSDAMNFTNTGYVRVYSNAGVYSHSYHVGLNPSKMVFYD
ncbi:MAG: hypothetical protein QNK23_18280 [Crocinitomicaceae bacterium]|nr:hypothetical protein [Crocinitomicaceae bacterium]